MVLFGLGTYVSNMMVKPYQSPVFDSPASYGLEYKEVEFKTKDSVTLRGWLINGGSKKVIIQSHFGVQCSRCGWTPAGKGFMAPWKSDVAFLRQAKWLSQNGYSVLMYDLRGHGQSDLGPIPWVSWGPEEANDVIAAVDYISSLPEFADASIGLLSICMGSGATAYAYGMPDGLASRKNIKALVAVQPLLYTYFIEALGMPKILASASEAVTKKRLGFDIAEPNFLDDADKINVPTMVIQNSNDPWTKLDMVQSFVDKLQVEKEFKLTELESSRFAAYDYIGREPGIYGAWFDKYM